MPEDVGLSVRSAHALWRAGAESTRDALSDTSEPVLLGRTTMPTPEGKSSTSRSCSCTPGAPSSPCPSVGRRRTLTTDISSDLLLAAPLHRVLGGKGMHWRSNAIGGDSARGLSEQVQEIDDFLSHDWGTSGVAKYMCLLVIFNSRPALVTGLLVGSLVPVFEVIFPDKLVYFPTRAWTAADADETRSDLWLVPLFIFWLVMLHGQSLLFFLRRMCACRRRIRGRMAFLDKLCIDQIDAARKQAGILALGAFLKHSKRLVIMFSPRYFTRLWCVHELATWSQLDPGSNKELLFMPVSLGVALFLVCIGSTAFVLASAYVSVLPEVLFYLWASVALGLLSVGPMVLMTFLGQDMRRIPDQLSRFDIRDAQCFCCTVGHVVSETGVALPCDRRLIYESIELWFRDRKLGDVANDDDWYLDLFNMFMQKDLRRRVRVFTDGTYVRYSHMLACVSAPVLMYLSCLLRLIFLVDLHSALKRVLMYVTCPCVGQVLCMKLSLLLCSRPRLCSGRLAWVDFVINISAIWSLFGLAWCAAVLSGRIHLGVQAALSFLMLLALARLQWPGLLNRCARRLL